MSGLDKPVLYVTLGYDDGESPSPDVDDGYDMADASQVASTAKIASRFGMIPGERHKQWVIDQMLRSILGPDGYTAWRSREDSEREAVGQAKWDEGVAP